MLLSTSIITMTDLQLFKFPSLCPDSYSLFRSFLVWVKTSPFCALAKPSTSSQWLHDLLKLEFSIEKKYENASLSLFLVKKTYHVGINRVPSQHSISSSLSWKDQIYLASSFLLHQLPRKEDDYSSGCLWNLCNILK